MCGLTITRLLILIMTCKNRKVVIDLDALQSNIALIKTRLAPGKQIMAYVKAQAYGHGISQPLISAMSQVDGFAVACLEEAKQIRSLTTKTVLLNGAHLCDETFQDAGDLDVDVVIHHAQFDLRLLALLPSLWLKVNTGMNRMGLTVSEARRLLSLWPTKPTVIMTHLADSLPYSKKNDQQVEQLRALKREYPHVLLSYANSSRLLSGQDVGDWVRPGLLIYGAIPFYEKSEQSDGIKAISRFCARVIAHQHLEAGDTVGYGRAYHASKKEKIAIVSAGYADGYPRASVHPLYVEFEKSVYPVVGKVSMDTLSICEVDEQLPEVGSWVILWGGQFGIEAVASACDRSPYELMVNLSERSFREYIGG